MKPKAIASLLILFIVAGAVPRVLGEKRTRCLYVLTYTFENRGDEPYILTQDDATIPLFQSNRWQTVRITNATYALAREHLDVDGNRLVVLDLPPEIPPHSSIVFSVTYEIESVDRPKPEIDSAEAGLHSDIPSELVEEFCVETETFALDEEVQALARSLAAEETTALGVVIQLLDWFIDNVTYKPFDVPRYPNETLGGRQGDCDDQSILFVTMCRALGIPALLQTGCVFNEGIERVRSSWSGHLRTEQRRMGWHGWALVYIPPWGWLPIDMTLTSYQKSLQWITEAPEYDSSIVTCLNISRQYYIGDSRRSRELLISSDLYIVVTEIMIKGNPSSQLARVLQRARDTIGLVIVLLLSTFPIFFLVFETILFLYCLSSLL